ncbi:hypothetical protein [Streptomyces sp. CBMA123]|uniref:hypothetical protein n=1 Tax=Streptomyces sp. CBMA123 TaxID=1896313 RepID=UPI0016620DA3|nr:hypothetical protein [Streptomyces sp. CBMA123]MBD0688850.1 hypothetical protein [Streptomyces sp. CBMA123]
MSMDKMNRTYARRLGQLLASDDGAAVLALLQALRADAGGVEDCPLPEVEAGTVAVWRRSGEDYVRTRESRDDWRYWADLDRLPLRPGHRRVVLLGESAARGYFYDPTTNLAELLGECFEQVPGTRDVDVVDLARTNATWGQLVRALTEAADLEPEALVLFAGNNWATIDLSPRQFHELAEAVRTGGYPAARLLFQRYVLEHARHVLRALATVAAGLGAAVTLVIPEFNLADWEEERSLLCPVLPGQSTAEWMDLRQRAQQALDSGDTAAAAAAARAMTELDQGASPVSQRLLAAALLKMDPQGAEQALVAAKEAPVGIFAAHSPRILSAVQEEMRRACDEYGFTRVDLAREFRSAAAGATPDRRFFMDYCHLSLEGLTLTASAVVSRLAPSLGGEETPADRLAAGLTVPAPGVQAVAHFLAAVHNAHYGQPTEVLRYHLETALAFDDGIAERLRDYLDYQSRSGPHWMCRSYAASASVPQLARYLQAGDTRLSGKLADHALRDVMVELLERRGVRVEDEYRKLLISEQAGPRVDLLADVVRAATFRERLGFGFGPARAHLVALDTVSGFYPVLARPQDVRLEATWRLPGVEERSLPVTVEVNSEAVAVVDVSGHWTTARIMVPARCWRTGVNSVRVLWPLCPSDGEQLLEAGARALERGEAPDSLPAYGHLHAFTASCTTGAPQEL